MRFGLWRIEPGYAEWEATHIDYDASWEGEEDGWVSNGLHTTAPTIEGLFEEILELEIARELPITPTPPALREAALAIQSLIPFYFHPTI